MSDSESPTAPPARLKMSDVARLAGVSVSTVSRALAGSPLIPKPLRDKIEAIAEEAGYAVNHSARTLRMQTTRTIGVVLPIGQQTDQRATDPFLIEMVGHLTDEVIKRGYDLLVSKAPAPRDGWLSSLIQSHRFDGMLMIGQSDQSAGLSDVARRYMPMVVWGERSPESAYCTVGVDNVYGGRASAAATSASSARPRCRKSPRATAAILKRSTASAPNPASRSSAPLPTSRPMRRHAS